MRVPRTVEINLGDDKQALSETDREKRNRLAGNTMDGKVDVQSGGAGTDDWTIRRIFTRILDVTRKHADAINANEGSVIVIESGGLPTPETFYRCWLALTLGTGSTMPGEDHLWICLLWTAGNLEWREIVPT